MMALRRGQAFLVAGALLLGCAVGAAVSTTLTLVSAHGGDTGKVHACYLTVPAPGNNPPLGSARIVKATEACKLNETAVDWPASALVSTYSKSATANVASLEDWEQTSVTCNGTDVAVGGGVLIDSNSAFFHVSRDYPSDSQTWVGRVNNDGLESTDFSVHVICAVIK
jgi:hypothetical protein